MIHLKRLGIGAFILVLAALLTGWVYVIYQGYWWSYIPVGLFVLYYTGYILTKDN